MTRWGDPVHDLVDALRAVRSAVAETDYPLPVPSAVPARLAAASMLGQIDDYALPRLAHLDAPLLAVVGGSTGAGKSTLVNSLVQAPVSAAGVLRPTTRAPVLVCHPADTPWFRSGRVLGTLARTTGGPATRRGSRGHSRGADPYQLQLISAPALPPGLAFLDAPDIDSVVETNRALASQLFAAADLWLFVTTAARYADAVPWQLLRTARERGTVIALVLDRVPPAATVEVVGLLSDLLSQHGLGGVPLFVVPEVRVDRQGLLPEPVTRPLRSWFDGLARDEQVRSSVIRCSLDGALAALPARLAELATAADEQLAAAEALAEQVGLAYGVARGTVERGLRPAPRQEQGQEQGQGQPAPGAVGLDEWSRALRTTVGNWRDRLAEVAGGPAGVRRPGSAESGLVTLVRGAAADAAEQVDNAWRTHAAGAGLLDGERGRPGRHARSRPAGPPGPSPELLAEVHRLAREEPGDDLLDRVGQLLDTEAARWLERLAEVPVDGSPAQRLRAVAAGLERARLAAGLVAGEHVAPQGEPPRPTGTDDSMAGTDGAASRSDGMVGKDGPTGPNGDAGNGPGGAPVAAAPRAHQRRPESAPRETAA